MEFEEILEKMKPEHADVIKAKFAQILKEKEAAETERDAAKQEAEETKKEFPPKKEDDETSDDEDDEQVDKADDKKTEGTTSFDEDETLLKSLPPEVQEYISGINKRLAAAEDFAKSAAAREKHAEAVQKAADLKALPIEHDLLVSTIEKSTEEFVDVLAAIAKGIEATVLTEVGSNDAGSFSKSAADAFEVMSQEADKLAKERGVTKEKAMSLVMDEKPELYKAYLSSLEGGAN